MIITLLRKQQGLVNGVQGVEPPTISFTPILIPLTVHF